MPSIPKYDRKQMHEMKIKTKIAHLNQNIKYYSDLQDWRNGSYLNCI